MSDATGLSVDGLGVRYGGVVALEDASLTVPAGELHGLIGPNGAGKTTFLDAVSGYTRPAAGTVTIAGRRCDGLAPHRIARLGLARTFQSLELFDDLTVDENLVVVAASRHRPFRSMLRPGHLDPDARERIDSVLTTTGLIDVRGLRPTELSNGARHRVALARALVAAPTVLLLDEPAAGLDPAETEELATILAEVARGEFGGGGVGRSGVGGGGTGRSGTAVLLVEHDMALVLGSCRRIHVLDGGRTIASGPPDEVRHDPRVLEAYLGVT